MLPATLSNFVKQHAASLSFDVCRIAPASTVDPENRLGQWLDAGRHATMAWMARTRDVRQDVTRKLPGAQSVVVVARNYFAQGPGVTAGAGRVSRYAWGRDYHRVLDKPVKKLARFIVACEPESEVYPSIDSGPVMEKAWAERAGVGWIGKNSLVLRRGMGSYFFLATILTTARMEPDSRVPEQCGGCTLCIDSCPTQAIVAPKVVDAGRCISYHTIENRGDVPPELADRFGTWAFGCDVCQDVCPWNRALRETNEPDFLPRKGNAYLDMQELESLDDAAFLARFAGTPIMRAKAAGMKRNAGIVRRNVTPDE